VLALAEAFPGAPIYTSTYVPEKMPRFAKLDVRTAYLQRPQDRSKSFTNSSQPCVFTPFESSIFRSTTSSSRAVAPSPNRSAKREMTKSTSATATRRLGTTGVITTNTAKTLVLGNGIGWFASRITVDKYD